MDPLEVIYEDNHLLVINKPAGIATMGAESGPTVHSMAADYIKKAYDKPGRVFVGVVSRLDSMTTGVLVLARTSKAASRLSAQFAGKSESDLSKIYLAAVDGHIDPPDGRLEDHVLKDDAARRMRLVDHSAKGSQQAALRYTTVGASEDISILAVQLLTGRKHQIRVQLADEVTPWSVTASTGRNDRFRLALPCTVGVCKSSIQPSVILCGSKRDHHALGTSFARSRRKPASFDCAS